MGKMNDVSMSRIIKSMDQILRALGVVLLLATLETTLGASPAVAASSYSYVRNFGSAGVGPMNFANPVGIAGDDSKRFSDSPLYVADWFNQQIKMYDKFGTFKGTIPAASQLSFQTYGIAAYGDSLYVSDGVSAVYRISILDGSMTGSITGLSVPRGLAIGNGNLFIAESGANCAKQYQLSGLGYVRTMTTSPPMNGPEGITTNFSGNVYVADTLNDRIVEFDSNGSHSASYPLEANSRPSGISTTPSNVYFFVSLPGSKKIAIYNQLSSPPIYEWSKGWVDITAQYPATPYENLNWSYGTLQLAWFHGDVYIVDSGNNRVVQITEGIHPVMKTGVQSISGSAADGDLQMGKASLPDRFRLSAGAMVTDLYTGLTWAGATDCYKCNNNSYCTGTSCCGGSGVSTTFNAAGDVSNWSKSLELIACLNGISYKSFNDWRLPNINELKTLVNFGQSDPSAWLRSSASMTWMLPSLYCSSTVDHSTKKNVLCIDFNTGLMKSRPAAFGWGYAVPVRSDILAATYGGFFSPTQPPYQTGQDSCYPVTLDGTTIPCTGDLIAGQDGAVRAGVPLPTPRFIDNAINTGIYNETIYDAVTGLTWLSFGSSRGPAACGTGERSWNDALQATACYNTNNYQRPYTNVTPAPSPLMEPTWRIPNMNELGGLMHHGGTLSPQYWFLSQGFHLPPVTPWSSTLDVKDASKLTALQPNFYGYQEMSTSVSQPDNFFPVAGDDGGVAYHDWLNFSGNEFKQAFGVLINGGVPVTGSRQVVLSLMPTNWLNPLKVELSSDGFNWTILSPVSGRVAYTLSDGDGLKEVYVRYTHVDNTTSQHKSTIMLDTSSPAAWANPASRYINTTTELVTINASEAARIYYTTDGSTPDPSLPGTSSDIAPAPVVVRPTIFRSVVLKFLARDLAGNVSPVYTENYQIDQYIPSASLYITSPPYTSSRDADLALGGHDYTGLVMMRFSEDNGANWSPPETFPANHYKKYTFNSAGDGVKCVSIQVQDAAGNWSEKAPSVAILPDTYHPSCILLDTVAPQTTISHTTTWYNSPQTVTLTCSDPGGSGCNNIFYTIDGSDPGPTSPSLIGNSGSLTISSNTLLRYYSLDYANNHIASPYHSQQFSFETTPPTVSITSPAHGARLPSLAAMYGTAFDLGGSSVNRVELQVTDGANYVQSNQGLSQTAAWIPVAVDTAGNWSFSTNSVPWTKPATYTITARAYDNAGNVSGSATYSFSIWNSAGTIIGFSLSSQSVKNGGSVSIITGKLTRKPDDPAYSLAGLPLTVTVTDPLEYGPPMVATYSTTTSDSAGHFTLSGITGLGGFRLEGTYTVTVSFADTPVGTPVLTASSASLPAMVGSTAGYAIIVEGKLKDDPDKTASAPYHNKSHSKTAQRVYEALKARGFADADIYNLNYDSTKSGVDAAPEKALVQSLITDTGPTYGAGPFNQQSTIFTKMVNNPGPLYIVLVDHGDPGNFYIDTDSATVTIAASELDQWLDTLETALAPFNMATAQKRIIINGSCYSGSFIPVLSKAGRIIIASAAATEQSFKGGMESDNVRSGEFFLEEFFGRLKVGDSFKTAFDYASDKVRTYTRSGSANSAIAPYFDDAIQHPLLDDDASGGGSNSLSTVSGDGVIAANLRLGFANDTTNAGSPADITSVSGTVILDGTNSAVLRATTANFADTLGAWVEVRKPSSTLAGNGLKGQLDPTSFNITRTALTGVDPTIGNPGDEYFTVTYDGFTESGMYEIFYYGQESVSGQPGPISPMKRGVVYKGIVGNTTPSAFTQLSPASQLTPGIPTNAIIFDWSDSSASTIAAGNRVTYTLEIATDSGFANNVYRKEEIVGSSTFIGTSAGLKDLTTYYWKVTAIDSYGASTIAGNAPFTFSTDNTNLPNYAGLQAKVYDSATSAPIAGAIVHPTTPGLTFHEPCTTDTAGQCILGVDAGVTISFEATRVSYQAATKNAMASVTVPVSVTFTLSGDAPSGLRIGTTPYTDLATAYAAAAAGSTIQLKAQTFTGPFNFNRTIAVTLEGGYDTSYSATRSGYTELTGPVMISSGQVTMDRVVVR